MINLARVKNEINPINKTGHVSTSISIFRLYQL